MQMAMIEAVALVAAGNAFLAGRDVGGFWPDAPIFRYAKSCEFLEPLGDEKYRTIAPDPNAWFATLKPDCRGLRLHNAPRMRAPNQSLPVEERMLAGFVGGGPRLLIEQVGAARSQLWEGFQRGVDPKAKDQKIWGEAYLLQGETEHQDLAAESIAQLVDELRGVLTDAEDLARKMSAENFAECFANAAAALRGEGLSGNEFYDDLARYAPLPPEALGLMMACEHAWVFGGMGSWNDLGAPKGLQACYDQVSETLYRGLIDALVATANSTYA